MKRLHLIGAAALCWALAESASEEARWAQPAAWLPATPAGAVALQPRVTAPPARAEARRPELRAQAVDGEVHVTIARPAGWRTCVCRILCVLSGQRGPYHPRIPPTCSPAFSSLPLNRYICFYGNHNSHQERSVWEEAATLTLEQAE